jgi:hypothetical protein
MDASSLCACQCRPEVPIQKAAAKPRAPEIKPVKLLARLLHIRSRQREEADFTDGRITSDITGAVRRYLHWVAPFLFSLSLASAVQFPLRWRWSNPSPHGANIVEVAYSTSLGLAVQVAERGQIFTSSDLDLWLPRDSNVTNALQGVTFFGQRIVVVGERGAVLYADDVSQFHSGNLLDGSTSDWLVAVAASPLLVVAAGDNGAIYTSANGVSWKRQNSGTNTWFSGVAVGPVNFVVVGEYGVVLTSPNGTNWIRRTVPTSSHLNRVSFASGMYTAVGDSGVTISSTNNGLNWYLEVSGATNTLQYAGTGGTDRLLDGDKEVRLQDGSVWHNELAKSNGPPSWLYYSAIGLPAFFIITGQSGMIAEGYQVGGNPYFWLTPYESVRNWLWDVTHVPGLYCATGDFGTIMTSGNGVDWTLELVPQSATNTTLLGVGGNTNLLLAAGDSGTLLFSPNILTNIAVTNGTTISTQTVSTLGVLWYELLPKPTTNTIQGVTAMSNSLYVLTGAKGTILTSPNGTNWSLRTSGTSNYLSSVTDWPGGLVATGDNGMILTSTDGITWTRRIVSTTNWLYRVRWLNGSLVAVGQNGIILTSGNGINWTNRASGTALWLNDVTFVDGAWFAIGLKGTVLSSTNLSQWTDRGTITKKHLYGAATDSDQLVLVGVEGVALRSQVVPDLTPMTFLDYDRVLTNGPSPAYNVYLFGGSPDQRFDLDRATSLLATNWTSGPLLEIFDGAGTLYYVESVSGTNLPPFEYYRTKLSP